MHMVSTHLPYRSTGYFSKIVLDYISEQPGLSTFYNYPVSVEGIKASVEARKQFATDRQLLVTALEQQYQSFTLTGLQQSYLQLLQNDNTFTICTAHQPNIFTGHLYFIYKILHTIRLAAFCKTQLPEYNFVPVYYMGSEDADLDELGHIYQDGIKYEWKTDQQGAVGRMKVDKALLQLIDGLSGQLLVHPYGQEMVALMKQCYQPGISIEQATLRLINELFAEYGLLVILPDSRLLKNAFSKVMAKELTDQFAHPLVKETAAAFSPGYKVQASGRELNLFYLQDNSRERIERQGEQWVVINTDKVFTQEEILQELKEFPERFSPNVILRPVFQETILPNIAFIGGGGEIAYWLELKKVFEAVSVPYPMLVVRNSFLLIDQKNEALISKLQLSSEDIFKSTFDLINALVKKESDQQLELENEKEKLSALYQEIKTISGKIDITLAAHTESLYKKALHRIEQLEKKMLKAAKQQFEAEERQLNKVKQQLFPGNNLQERVDNFMLYYAKKGKDFIKVIYENSLSLQQEFMLLKEQ